jgi:large subunit ribosomal protein L15
MFTLRFFGVNLSVLAKLAETHSEINREILVKSGIIKSNEVSIKILGSGELAKPIKVTADRFSKSAKRKIEAVGGSVIERPEGA